MTFENKRLSREQVKELINIMKNETEITVTKQSINEGKQIKATNVELNQDLVFSWLTLGEDGYMTTQEVAEMLNVTPQNIRTLVMNHVFKCVNIVDQHLKQLKQLGVIPLKTPTVNLLPESTIDDLVKIVNTPEAKEIWKQILNKVRNRTVTGDMAAVFNRMSELEGKLPLTAEQVIAILKAIEDKYTELGWLFKGKYKSTTVILQAKLTTWGFPDTPKEHCKWRELPQNKFADAIDFIKAYKPSASERYWYSLIVNKVNKNMRTKQ